MSDPAATPELFRKGGDLWSGVPLQLLELDPIWRTAAIEVMAVIADAARAKELDERLTDERIAEALDRSESFVQKGLFALDYLPRLVDGVRILTESGKGLIDRAREHGRRTITLVRGLATRGAKAEGTKAAPPGPPEEQFETTTTGGQGSPPSSPSTTDRDHPLIARGLALIPDATAERIAAAIGVYSAEWVAQALDLVERRNKKPGNLPVKGFIFALRVLENWRKDGGPPAPPPTAPAATPSPTPTAAPEPPRRLDRIELADLVRQATEGPPAGRKLAALGIRLGVKSGEIPAELLAEIPPALLHPAEPHRRE